MPIHKIIFAEAFGDGSYIYTQNKVYVVKESLKKLEIELKEHLFIRTHRSYIISLKYVKDIGDIDIGIIGREERIPISRRMKNNVKEKVSNYLKVSIL